AGAVGAAQVVQGPADAVVVEQEDLVGLQAEVLGDAACDPGGQGVQRLASQEQVGQQHRQGDGRGQRRLSAGQRGQMLLEQLRQLQPREKALHQGGGAHLQGLQGCLLPRQGHSCLPVQRGRLVCCGSCAANGNKTGSRKKILAGLGGDAGQPG